MAEGLFGISLAVSQKSLDALWLRYQVVSGNIANVDTPGYKRRGVEFEELLKSALDRPGTGEGLADLVKSVEPEVLEENGTQLREDGNNVDVDAEDIELVRTQIQYEFMARSVSDQLSRMKYVVTEGRG